MKKLIALYGIANAGKSATIRLVYDKLAKLYPDHKFHKDVEAYIPAVNEKGDIRVVIIINGKTIGIESQGDPNSRLFESLPLFVKCNCDIIICATRTRGGTVEAVEQLYDTYNIEWVEKQKGIDEGKYEIENNKIADMIIKEIQSCL